MKDLNVKNKTIKTETQSEDGISTNDSKARS